MDQLVRCQKTDLAVGKLKQRLENAKSIKSKGSPYSITDRRVPELIPAVSL